MRKIQKYQWGNSILNPDYGKLQKLEARFSGLNFGNTSTFLKNASVYTVPFYHPTWMKEQYQSTLGPVGVISPNADVFGPDAGAQTVNATTWKNQQSSPASKTITQTEQQTATAANPTPVSVPPPVYTVPVLPPVASTSFKLPKMDEIGSVKQMQQIANTSADKIATTMQTRATTPDTKTGGASTMSSGLQSGLSAAGSMLGSMSGKDLEPEQLQMREGIRSAIGKMGPIGCVCAGTRVITNDGEFVNIEDLQKEDGIIGWDGKVAVKQSIFEFQRPEIKPCVEIVTERGTVLQCSTDHPIASSKPGRANRVTVDGVRRRVREYTFIDAENLQVGDYVATINEVPIFGDNEMWNPYLVGLLIGDGSYGKRSGVSLSSSDPETWDFIESFGFSKRCNICDSSYSKEFRVYRLLGKFKELIELEIYAQTKTNKRLPSKIHLYNRESVADILAGLFDSDGYILKGKFPHIAFCQSNIVLLNEVREQLLKFGIHSSIKTDKEHTTTVNGRDINSQVSYRLIIKDKESIQKFFRNIPIRLSYKRNNLAEIVDSYTSDRTKDNRELAGAHVDKIVAINNIGDQYIYNLQADDYHTYIANGVITHNSIIAAASGVVDMVGDVTGLNLDNMDKNAAQRFNIKGAGLNNFMNNLPGNSMVWGSFMGKTDEAHKSDMIDEYRGGFSGSAGDIDAAVALSDKRFLFGKKKANSEIGKANAANQAITNIGLINNLRKQSTYGQELSSQNQRKYSGQTSATMHIGKQGMKLEKVKTELQKFKEGGKLNVIMDGSLHSRLNHLDEKAEALSDITPKGIPVVSIEEGGKLQQHAEIEKGELILNKDLTTKIEALWHDGSEGAMIQAGKLLAAELVMNTDDKTGEIIDGDS